MVIIYWYPEGGEEQYRQCESRMNIIYQSPGGSGGDGPTITIDGTDYTGDGNTINYKACEDGSITFTIAESVSFTITPTDDGVKIGGNTSGNLSNGTHNITYDAVTEGQEKETTIKFTNDNDETTTIKLKRKCSSQCTDPCGDLDFEGLTNKTINASADGGTYKFKYKCCKELVPKKGNPDYTWFSVTAGEYDAASEKAEVTVTVTANGTNNPRTSTIQFTQEGTSQPCTGKFVTVSQPAGGGQQDEWTFTVEAKNITANETVYVNGVEILTAGVTLSYTQSQKIQLVPGASTTFNNASFTGTASIGDEITGVALLLSCSNSGGDAPQTILCNLTGTSRTIQDGAHYRIEYNGGLGCS